MTGFPNSPKLIRAGLVLISPETGSVTRIIQQPDIERPNGIALTQDSKTQPGPGTARVGDRIVATQSGLRQDRDDQTIGRQADERHAA